MRNQNIARNILLGFLFFFIGRYIVSQMGDTGVWIIIGLVVIFYTGWWYFQRSDRNKMD